MSQWIKVDWGIVRDSKLEHIANYMKAEYDLVIGLVVKFWIWIDQHTLTGSVYARNLEALAWLCGSPLAFLEAMIEVKWLEYADNLASVPGFEKRFVRAAKVPDSSAERMRRLRARAVAEPPLPFADAGDSGILRTDETATSPARANDAADIAVRFVAAWNAVPGLSPCDKLSSRRQRLLDEALKRESFREGWHIALARLGTLPFMRGMNRMQWRATIDWFLKPDSVEKVLDGNYDNLHTGTAPAPPVPTEAELAADVASKRAAAKADAEKSVPMTDAQRKQLRILRRDATKETRDA